MTKNVGGIDRILRAAIGLVLIALAATGTVGWWGYLGLIPLATAAMGWCLAVCAVRLEHLLNSQARLNQAPVNAVWEERLQKVL